MEEKKLLTAQELIREYHVLPATTDANLTRGTQVSLEEVFALGTMGAHRGHHGSPSGVDMRNFVRSRSLPTGKKLLRCMRFDTTNMFIIRSNSRDEVFLDC